MQDYPIGIRNAAGNGGPQPVTGGIPLAQGEAPAGTAFVLVGKDGPVPTQATRLATWPDGSARWLLLDAVTRAGDYALRTAVPPAPPSPAQATGTSIGNGRVRVECNGTGLRIGDRCGLALEAIDARGRTYTATFDRIETESSGPIRATLALSGALRDASGARLFSCRLRASVHAGSGDASCSSR